MPAIADLLARFEAFPEADIEDVLHNETALILAPHADDESLGCGGLIAAASAAGLPPFVAVMTDGAASHPGSRRFPPSRLAATRQAEARCAAAHLGLPPDRIVFLNHPDTRLPSSGTEFDTIVDQIIRLAAAANCTTLIAPWQGDPHCDHEAAAAIGQAVATRAGLRLLSYPVWGWLRDGAHQLDETRKSGWRLDITAFLTPKQQAIAAHVSQYGDLIDDSPAGFRLPADLLNIFARPYEIFIA